MRDRTVLPFGVAAIDRVLPGGGLAVGALHEVAGGGNGAVDGAAAALFAAGIAARTAGKVLWCVTRPDLFAPAIEQAGLRPGRVIYVEAGDEKSVLACFEEGLRGGFGAVVAEIARLSMTASRRLQLAAESSGAIGIAIRRWRRQTEATDFGQPTAAETRWRVSVRRVLLSSAMLGVRGRIQREGEVVHLVAHELTDLSAELASVGNRETPFPLPHGRGDEAHRGGSGIDPRGMPEARDIVDPYEHIDRIKVKTRDFR
ncbi:ImuA family protein [Mesorhizobium sp. L-2-11]|uniref:ImuA family protein n=1 Tax=Mesorhizobium sp. L-2-11 TaxID=2744521 RepID=UPI0019362F52|nr:damage-inducible protein [Mesorhizobium sp. L-2-11]BCH19583.1 hypothetical protein MesoLjLa_64340 [Mesorhizobium sp. L-2-11]